MAIVHRIHAGLRLVVSSFDGAIDDDTLLTSYAALYGGPRWKPGFEELADLRRCDMRGVTSDGLRRLSRLAESHVGDHVDSFRTAILVTSDLPFGLARMYGVYSETSSETVQVFRDEDQALDWLEIQGSDRERVKSDLAAGTARDATSPDG